MLDGLVYLIVAGVLLLVLLVAFSVLKNEKDIGVIGTKSKKKK